MQILEFIFKLLANFIQFEPGRIEQLKEQAYKWQHDEKAKEDSKFSKIIALNEQWYVQVLLAIVFLFAVKSIRKWLLDESSSSDTDDDQDDDEDDTVSIPRHLLKAIQQKNKFQLF